jgi:ribosomal protein S18 acetylase RimI-like enzyme
MRVSIKQWDALQKSELILSMDRVCFPEDDPPLIDRFTSGWIVKVRGAIAGYALARLAGGTPNALYMSRCGVLPEYRGLGLQQLMIAARYEYACEEGYQEVITDTQPMNLPSCNNLIKQGFTLYEPTGTCLDTGTLYWKRVVKV